MLDLASAAPAADTLPLFLPQAPPDKVSGLIHVATLLAQLLGQGRAVDSRALRSAMADGGRLVAITGHNLAPDNPACRDSFIELQRKGRVVFTAAISGRAYAVRGHGGGRLSPPLLPANAAATARFIRQACILQIVSTNEALLDRRLAAIPASEWADLSIDITPREYVLDYLQHSFPTQLFELFSDDEGNLYSRPAYDADGNPVISREAVERRDRMIEHLASLPPVQGALDQILHRFGTDLVAEVTGRSRRVVRRNDRLCIETRAASANFAETSAFMDDEKPILVFSDAGGTGRSYHADLNCKNQRPRIHYLLEPGWRADAAIQGSGRSNRTNQKQPPVFRPVATDVKGEKRFLSTIARRLDTLGAITRGQRQTGGQGLFRADDNLESPYAKAALRQFYQLFTPGRSKAARSPNSRTRPGSISATRRLVARGIAADHAIPQSRAGAAASRCRTGSSPPSRTARGAHRGRGGRRHLRHRRRDADRRELPRRRASHRSYPRGDRCRNPLLPRVAQGP